LEKFDNDIYLWRFYRRAARDEAGHQFSFMFYASSLTAYSIYQDLSNDILHLNALFGYEPLVVYEKRLLKF
jgi:hypothetical protein